jgi:hypothetical protein
MMNAATKHVAKMHWRFVNFLLIGVLGAAARLQSEAHTRERQLAEFFPAFINNHTMNSVSRIAS